VALAGLGGALVSLSPVEALVQVCMTVTGLVPVVVVRLQGPVALKVVADAVSGVSTVRLSTAVRSTNDALSFKCMVSSKHIKQRAQPVGSSASRLS
jgi:hypothetical protein